MFSVTVSSLRNTKKGFRVDRATPLGNPFSHLDLAHTTKCESRDQAIQEYRVWLKSELNKPNSPAYAYFLKLAQHLKANGSITLLCWCKPKACHADVIADALHCLMANI